MNSHIQLLANDLYTQEAFLGARFILTLLLLPLKSASIPFNMFLKKFFQQLSQTKKYILYTFLPLIGWLILIQGYKFHQSHRSSVLQSDLLHKATQRKGLQKKNEQFSVTQHLNEAFAQYSVACQQEGRDEFRYAYLTHHHFADFIADHTDLIDSMRNHHPIMDKDTYSNLYLFVGPEGSPGESYCNLFAKKVNILTSIGKYHFFMMLAGANNDPTRIKRYQKIQRVMEQDITRLYKCKGIFSELVSENCPRELMDFYLRDKHGSKKMQLVKFTIRAEYLVPSVFLDMADYVGFDLRKALEESKLSAWVLKMIHLHLLDIEYFLNFDRIWVDLVRCGNTWGYYLSKLWIPIKPGKDKYPPPAFSNGLIAKTINGLWWICTFGKADSLINTNSSGDSLLDCAYWMVTYPLFALKYMIKEPMDIIDTRIYKPYQSTFGPNNRYKMYTNATNEGLVLLKQVQRLKKLMKKFERAIKGDKELMELCEPYLKPIRYLLHSPSLRNLRYILRETAKISDVPITVWDLFSFSDSRVTDILRLVKQFDELPEEEEKALMEALACFCLLETFVSISTFSVENSQKKSDHGFVLGKIIESQDKKEISSPDINLKGIYSLFIPLKKVVKNDFKNVRDPKTGEEMIVTIQGLNGAGKSIDLRTILEAEALFHAIGRILGDEGEGHLLDYMRFYANIKDNPAKSLSLMMAEVKKLNELLSLADGMAPGEKGLFILDEPGKGTTTEESGPLVLSVISYLQQKHNNVTILSTHINTLFDIAKRARYKKLTPFTPGFDTKKGFTYKIEPGMATHPVCIHVLEKMHFHPSVLKGTVALLAEDPNYRFKTKLRAPTNEGMVGSLFGGGALEQALLLLLILLIGMLLGTFLPNTLHRTGPNSRTKNIKMPEIS